MFRKRRQIILWHYDDDNDVGCSHKTTYFVVVVAYAVQKVSKHKTSSILYLDDGVAFLFPSPSGNGSNKIFNVKPQYIIQKFL